MPTPDNSPLNPYAAPQAELQPTATQPQRLAKGSSRSWLIVFLANLPLPTLIGSLLCDWDGRYGMFLAIAMLLLLSSWFVVAKPWLGRRLIAGGVGVAISQGLPILHLLIAGVGGFLVEAVGLYIPPPPVRPPAMMFLTLFVGLGLMLAAFAISWLPIFLDPNELPENDDG